MASLLNTARPPVFCPGCSHERIVNALDAALQQLQIPGENIVLVSDIGCSGLFDVFFHTHAFHGLHGRALTYALGLKMARPELHVIVTMGDGGLGIGGAHLLSSCRRNADMTLLILNNFNFGMTGGQYSATTPEDGVTSSRFLNQLEMPLDVCRVAEAAGAPFVSRCSGLADDIAEKIGEAISYKGFSVVDIWGICTGRYSKKNSLSPKTIREKLASLAQYDGVCKQNERPEFAESYKTIADALAPAAEQRKIECTFSACHDDKKEILILGSAGQRIVTAGELLCFAAMSSGMKATQKNDYDITVLKGPSVSEIILWPDSVGFTAIEKPDVVLVLSEDGVTRRRAVFSSLTDDSLIICSDGVTLPQCRGEKKVVDFKSLGISSPNMALAALAVLAEYGKIMTPKMLDYALRKRFNDDQYRLASRIIACVNGP